MKVIGEFNKISEELKKEIPKLKPAQVVTFQMLNGVPNPEPDEKERQKLPMIYPKTQIRSQDRIYDPYLNDYVDIGIVKNYVKSRDGQYDIDVEMFIPGLQEPGKPAVGGIHFSGKFSLTGGNVAQEEAYQFLMICNQNASNPHRDKSVPALFKPINLLEDSKETIRTTNALRDALNYVSDLDVTDAKQIAAALNWPTYNEDAVLMAKMNDFASKFPDTFLNTANSPKTKTKAIIKKAQDANIITFDTHKKTVTLGSELIATLIIREGENFLNSFTDWINTSRNGAEVFENIKNQIEAKKEEANTVTKRGKKKEEAIV